MDIRDEAKLERAPEKPDEEDSPLLLAIEEVVVGACAADAAAPAIAPGAAAFTPEEVEGTGIALGSLLGVGLMLGPAVTDGW